MRAAIKRTASSGQITLPPAALAALSGGDEVDVWVLRKGVVLLTESGALEGMDEKKGKEEAKEKNALTAPLPASPAPKPKSVLSADEVSVVRKLLTIRFEERTVPAVAKKIGAAEKKTLDALVARRLIEVFRNAKYKEGVYNISQKVYEAAAAPMNEMAKKEVMEPARSVGSEPANKTGVASAPLAFSSASARPLAYPSSSGAPPINSAEHLAKFGYMVLNTENEAKMAMMQIQPMLKTDDVRGIRGFDKRYYVLRRSFLHQYAGLVLAQLDAGPATAEKISEALGLASEAVGVILMIMADEGEVIEKRRGDWERA